MSWIDISIIIAAVVAAACLQASIGFGMGMVAAPVIALINPQLLPATIIMLALMLTLIVVIRERESLDIRGAGWALLGRIPGSLLGVWLVIALPASGMAWMVACVVLAGVVMSIFGWAPLPGRVNLITAGAASGVMGTATSIGGAPMALVWQRSQGAVLRGTMSAFFLVGSLVSLAGLILFGAVDLQTIQFVLMMMPAMLAGYLLSRLVNRYLNRKRLRLTALFASAGGAGILIVNLLLS